jgi:hypothetical protein
MCGVLSCLAEAASASGLSDVCACLPTKRVLSASGSSWCVWRPCTRPSRCCPTSRRACTARTTGWLLLCCCVDQTHSQGRHMTHAAKTAAWQPAVPLCMRLEYALMPAACLLRVVSGLLARACRSRVACAEEVGSLIEREGPRVYSGEGAALGSAGRSASCVFLLKRGSLSRAVAPCLQSLQQCCCVDSVHARVQVPSVMCWRCWPSCWQRMARRSGLLPSSRWRWPMSSRVKVRVLHPTPCSHSSCKHVWVGGWVLVQRFTLWSCCGQVLLALSSCLSQVC